MPDTEARPPIQLLGISGSLRRESYSTAVLRTLEESASGDVRFDISDLSAIPLYNQDNWVYLDILFDDPAWYRRVVDSGLIDAHLVSRLYRVPERDVLGIIAFDPAHAVKITLRRQRVAGDLGETDVYGAQHHAPLVDLELDL